MATPRETAHVAIAAWNARDLGKLAGLYRPDVVLVNPDAGELKGREQAIERDRVFIDCNLNVYNTVMRTGWYPNITQQTMIRAQTKLEFAWGVAFRMAEAINSVQPPSLQQLGEMALMLGMEMGNNHERHARVRRHRVKKRAQRLQPAGRGTDPNNG